MKLLKNQPGEPTLSLHLLRIAERFFIYPRAFHKSRSTVAARQYLDDIAHGLVEWRKTFGPTSLRPGVAEFVDDPVILDQLYCRELLNGVPKMVERTRALAAFSLDGVDAEGVVYLREAANCYIRGLPQAALAMARAAIEIPLRREAAKRFGEPTIKGAGLFELLKDFAARGKVLTPRSISQAHRVRVAADDVLHEKPVSPEQVLDLLHACRAVVAELV